jgi:chemotaxis protein MotB
MRGSGILLGLICIAFFVVGCVPVVEVEAMKSKWLMKETGFESRIAQLTDEGSRLRRNSDAANMALRDMEEKFRQQQQKLKGFSGRTPGIDWIDTGDSITVRLPNKILFDSGKTKLKSQYLGSLRTVGEILRDEFAGNIIRVEGHTDNVPIVRNTDKYPTNWELSCHRACEVVRYLVSKGFVPTRRVYAAGFGQYKWITSNATRAGKAENRRVEIVILPPRGPAESRTKHSSAPAPDLGPEDTAPADTMVLK